jgi:hypothetical protein
MMKQTKFSTVMLLALGAGACDGIEVLDPGRGSEARDLEGGYSWIFEGWDQN